MVRAAVAVLSLCLLTSACDRDAAPTPPPVPATAPAVEVRPLAPLLPHRRTHVAVTPAGDVFWSQEQPRGDDAAFAAARDGSPRVTQLTSANILAAIGARARPDAATQPAAAAASGNIQSLAVGPDGAIYFFFSGGTGRNVLAAFGRFRPASNELRVLADTAVLAASSGMGRSLALARGTVVTSGGRVWLWLRHTDISVFFALDPKQVPAAGKMRSLPLAFDDAADASKLTDERQTLAAGPGETLLVTDPAASELWQLDAKGRLLPVRPLVGLPAAMSDPAVSSDGSLYVVAGDSERFPARTQEHAAYEELEADFPALLRLDVGNPKVFSRFEAHAGFHVQTMRVEALVRDVKPMTWVAYDETSGELLRLRLRGSAP